MTTQQRDAIKVIFLVGVLLFPYPSFLETKKFFVASSWDEYLQIVPISMNKGIPLVFDSGDEESIERFGKIYNRRAEYLSDPTSTIRESWKNSNYLVLSEKNMESGIVACEIAAHLNAPLLFEPPKDDILKNLNVTTLVLVGNVSLNLSDYKTISLKTPMEGANFYQSLIEEPSFIVITNPNDRYAFLSAEIAAFHKGIVFFESVENPTQLLPLMLKVIAPKNLAWVTSPENLTFQNVQNLYALCNFDIDRWYDLGVGIITGKTPEDASLLLAREHWYKELGDIWKKDAVVGLMNGGAEMRQKRYGDMDVTVIERESCTIENFKRETAESKYAWVEAHGDPKGILMADGFLDYRNIPPLYPLIFVAESCNTADIGSDPTRSFALEVIHNGAAGYVGSIKTGGVGFSFCDYLFSSPDMPLGELVRVGNIRSLTYQNLFFGVPEPFQRGILIGDPLFCQFNEAPYKLSINRNEDYISVKIDNKKGIGLPKLFEIELPYDIWYAGIWKSGKNLLPYERADVGMALDFTDGRVKIFPPILGDSQFEVRLKNSSSQGKSKPQIVPEIVSTFPQNNSVVKCDIEYISFAFNVPTRLVYWQGLESGYPGLSGEPIYGYSLEDSKIQSCGYNLVIPVKLEKGRTYSFSINEGNAYAYITDFYGNPLLSFTLTFSTEST